MPTRMTPTEFINAINRENGDLLRLFTHTVVDPDRAPEAIADLCGDANELWMRLDAVLDHIAEVLGYEREET